MNKFDGKWNSFETVAQVQAASREGRRPSTFMVTRAGVDFEGTGGYVIAVKGKK